MRIYFSFPITSLGKFKNNYIEIRESIIKSGHIIKSDLLPKCIRLLKEKQTIVPTRKAYEETASSIIKSDAVICDVTVRSTTMGHIITLALDKRKPVLVLYQSSSNNPNQVFLSMYRSPLLTVESYDNTSDILPIIKQFTFNAAAASKTRFNLVINKAQNAYLDWASFTNKKSKTQIIQEAIDEKVKRDKNYKKY